MNRKLQELRLQSVLRQRVAEDPVARRIREDAEAIEKQGKSAVLANANLKRMRGVLNDVVKAAKPIVAKLNEAQNDERLTPDGRRSTVLTLQAELELALVGVMEKFNEAEKSLIESYPKPEPWAPDLTEGDLNRSLMVMNQFTELGPIERLQRFGELVQARDVASVWSLLPLVRSALKRPELEKLPVKTIDQLTTNVALGEDLVRVSRKDAWKEVAHEVVLEEASRVRSEADHVVELLTGSERTITTLAPGVSVTSGDQRVDVRDLQDVTIYADGLNEVRRLAGLRRDDGVLGGAFPSLEPLDEAEA